MRVMSYMNESCHTVEFWRGARRVPESTIPRYIWVMLLINESRHECMSYGTSEWVISRMDESRHMWLGAGLWMSHVIYEWVMSLMHESRHAWMSRVKYAWVTSHVTGCRLMNGSCQLRMSYVTHAAYEWVVSNTKEFRHEWVMSLMPRMNAFLDGYCSTVQGLLDWFEIDLGFTELLFIQIDLCVMCVSYVTHAAYEWVVSNTKESRHEWQRARDYAQRRTPPNESCHSWMSHVTHE